MVRKISLSIFVAKKSATQDDFDPIFDDLPLSAPPTTISAFPVNLPALSEACETCDACRALAGPCTSPVRDDLSTNGLGSPRPLRRRRRGSLDNKTLSRAARNRPSQSALPARRRTNRMRVDRMHDMSSGTCDVVSYESDNMQSSSHWSNESSPATTPTDERTSLDGPCRSLSLGNLSLAAGSSVDLPSMMRSHSTSLM